MNPQKQNELRARIDPHTGLFTTPSKEEFEQAAQIPGSEQLITVQHRTSKKGRIMAKIDGDYVPVGPEFDSLEKAQMVLRLVAADAVKKGYKSLIEFIQQIDKNTTEAGEMEFPVHTDADWYDQLDDEDKAQPVHARRVL